MLDVHFPTTDGRTLILSRYTEPNADERVLLDQLSLTLPPQPPDVVETFRPEAPFSGASHPLIGPS